MLASANLWTIAGVRPTRLEAAPFLCFPPSLLRYDAYTSLGRAAFGRPARPSAGGGAAVRPAGPGAALPRSTPPRPAVRLLPGHPDL